MTTNKWGGLASFLLAVSFVVAPLIYLTRNLRDTLGVFAYDLADFLYGPIVSASLITVTYVLREIIGKSAFRRMDLVVVAAVLSAVGMASVAFIRASNRHYHLMHPLLGSANGTSRLFPRPLTGFYFLAGVSSLFVYRFPDLEGLAMLLGTIIGVWQGILLWNFDSHKYTKAD